MIEVVIEYIDPITEVQEAKEALRSYLHGESTLELKVTMARKPIRGTTKAFIKLEEARGLKLLKATYMKIGWVPYRTRRKKRKSPDRPSSGDYEVCSNSRGSPKEEATRAAKQVN